MLIYFGADCFTRVYFFEKIVIRHFSGEVRVHVCWTQDCRACIFFMRKSKHVFNTEQSEIKLLPFVQNFICRLQLNTFADAITRELFDTGSCYPELVINRYVD